MTQRYCDNLNGLEARADLTGGIESPAAPAYEDGMRIWRHAWQLDWHQPSCRIEGLGHSLCRMGAIKTPNTAQTNWGLTGQWKKYMVSLAEKQRNDRDCHEFVRFHENMWVPPLWHWAESTPGLRDKFLNDLVADPEYAAYYGKAVNAYPKYGSPAVNVLRHPEGAFTHKRVQELTHIRVLRQVAGMVVSDLVRVVEFGGGTGETAAVFRDLGFNGRHIIIDLPPMLLFQRYWLRYAGFPAYLAADTNGPITRSGMILETTFASDLFGRHLEGIDSSKSLFLGLWSFTEAGLDAREAMWPLIMSCGTFLLSFGNEFDGIDNVAYLTEAFERWDLWRTHHVLSWHLSESSGHYYLIAMRRDIGTLNCTTSVGCRESSMHQLLPSSK